MSLKYILRLSGTTSDNTAWFLEAMRERCGLVTEYTSDFGETFISKVAVDRVVSRAELEFLCAQNNVDACIFERIQ